MLAKTGHSSFISKLAIKLCCTVPCFCLCKWLMVRMCLNTYITFPFFVSPCFICDVRIAGIYGLSACNNSVSIHRLGHLSYSAREFLASTLNQKQTEFCQLCQAMEVESSLMQASLRSRNPTAYLIQELPDTTIDRLEKALSKIGRSDLFTALSRHFDDSDDDDCV